MAAFASMLMGEVRKKAEKYFNKDDGKERSRQIICDDVFLYTTRITEPLSFSYEVGSTCPKTLRITLNFNGSENFTPFDERDSPLPELKICAEIAPFSRMIIGSMKQADPRLASRLAVDYVWELVEVNQAQIRAAADQQTSRVNEQMHNQLNGGQGNFIDTTFPPNSNSLYTVNRDAGEGEAEGSEPEPDEVIVWHRPVDFMGGSFDVFIGGIEPSDICQGSLGDCWFLCSLACLGEFPEYVTHLFSMESQAANHHGRYQIRLCHYGVWETVVVDDFFPCYPDGGPVYARGHDNELWVLLLEKAYAKLCGSYAALKSGWAYEAMIDLTGAPFCTIRFEEEKTIAMIEDGSLWHKIREYDDMGYIQSASTPGEDTLTVGGSRRAKDDATGLVAGHAYAILRIRQTSCGTRLLEIRNPWGEGGMEWTGDWSDKSPLWTEELKVEMDARIKEDDGAFWMSFEDFVENFYSINVCMVRQPDRREHGQVRVPWFESRERFQYQMMQCSNEEGPEATAPCYLLTIHERCQDVYVSVHQKDTRCVGAGPYIDIGVTVLAFVPGTQFGYALVASTGNSADRQNQTEVMSLEAGQYLVVPTTTGCKLRKAPGGGTCATIVIHSSRPHTLTAQPYNHDAAEEAIELPIVLYGTARVLDAGKVTLYTRKSGFSGVSYVIQNTHNQILKFTQDCSMGKNIVSHRNSLVYEVTVQPGHCEVLHHIMPDNNNIGWQSGFSASYDWV